MDRTSSCASARRIDGVAGYRSDLGPCLDDSSSTVQREQLVKGVSVVRNPVGLDTLLKGYKGRRFVDASPESPGKEIEEDVTPAAVRREPEAARRTTTREKWVIRDNILVRAHGAPRLTLFTPDKVPECPVKYSQLAGRRIKYLEATR